jgi:hypothetical protein
MSERPIKLTTLTLTERILQSKCLDECSTTNQIFHQLIKLITITLMTKFFDLNLDQCSTTNQILYQLIKLKTLTLMTRFFDLNYFQDFRTNQQTHNSYPDWKNLAVKVLGWMSQRLIKHATLTLTTWILYEKYMDKCYNDLSNSQLLP